METRVRSRRDREYRGSYGTSIEILIAPIGKNFDDSNNPMEVEATSRCFATFYTVRGLCRLPPSQLTNFVLIFIALVPITGTQYRVQYLALERRLYATGKI